MKPNGPKPGTPKTPPAPAADAAAETLGAYRLGLVEVARRAGVTRKTVHNWVTHGVRVRGAVVRLGAIRLGGRWRTSSAALAEFLRALGAAAEPPAPPARGRTPRQERRAHERAVEELRRAGILPRE